MSASNFPSVVNGSGERNGTTARGTASARGAKRPAAKRTERGAKPSPEPAALLKAELQAKDAEMWPIHPVMWLQPELRLAVTASSGLHIERKHTVPSPDFVREAVTPASQAPSPAKSSYTLAPDIALQFPASGLAPLGWDPRVAAHGTGKEEQE